jgi:hypothetical protein
MLTPPTAADLGQFRGVLFGDSEDTSGAEYVLQQATDAFMLMTMLSDTPTDEFELRVYTYAICDLALWLTSHAEHLDEINSPFSSERIGSYSYSKLVAQARKGEDTGIYWLDLALSYFRANSGWGSGISISSENVMQPDGATFAQTEWREQFWDVYYHDPSNVYGG